MKKEGKGQSDYFEPIGPVHFTRELKDNSIDFFVKECRRIAGLENQEPFTNMDLGKIISQFEGLEPLALYNLLGNHWTLVVEPKQGNKLEVYDPLAGLREVDYKRKIGPSLTLYYFEGKRVHIGLDSGYKLPRNLLEALGPIQTRNRPTDCGPLSILAGLVARNLERHIEFFPL